MNFFEEHLERLRTGAGQTYNLSQLPRWICDHTRLRGKNYSFRDHEFQEKIVSDTSQIINVSKCSQIGLSELMARWTLGVCEIFPGFGAIVTFPFSGDSENFARTRVDPIITGSPRLTLALNPKLNNAEVKQFHESLLYFRGTNGKTQAISTPADAIISDEIDRSDPHMLTMFESRLTHSEYKLRRNFSTPTIPGWGVSLEMETSRRHRNLCKCHACNNWYLPDYYEHVKIPGYDRSLRELTKVTIARTRYLEAALLCPRCGAAANLQPEYRGWNLENPNDNFEAAGYYVSPFDAPNIIQIPWLVHTSTKYAKRSEFDNQNLGKTAEDSSEALTLQDLNDSKTTTDLTASLVHCMGIDLGLVCYITVGRLHIDGRLLVVHREPVLLGDLETRRVQLARQYRCAMTVSDVLPYTDVVRRMQLADSTVFGGHYGDSPTAATYEVRMHSGDATDGKLPVNLVKIQRDRAFDEVLGLFKAKEIKIYQQDISLDELFDKHALDMKRVQLYDSQNELKYSWVKSKQGDDHFLHSLVYLLAACRMRGVSVAKVPLVITSPFRTVSARTR